MAVFEITSGENDLNEIHQYQKGRYISSNEAVWRILNIQIHERHLTVIHLRGAQAPEETTLISFFRPFTQDEFARTLLHNEVPKCYTWNNGNKTCQRCLMRNVFDVTFVFTIEKNHKIKFH
ncbi:hypothetical protein AVEN_26481-1 [Araneus ventricosus]|uniref:Uncharacterized protein n=1 Tax=Araneus ventricosus TaxID=182803 RepID=A0A4Y2CUN9_ARAVE|nr:hypothetical protein AVEN_26481-1 [Araneus ventricosus]